MTFFSSPLFFNFHLFITIFLLFSRTDSVSGCYTSIFSFGDSFSDTGNGLYLKKSSLMGNFPYGETYFHHPNGRSSDGRVLVDFIAQAFGLPLLPPYLAFSDGSDLRQGVNFAVSGAPAMDSAFFEQRNIMSMMANISLGNQISWFKGLLPSLCHSPSGCREYLRGSLFIVGSIGGNDYYHPFINGLSLEEMRTYVPQVVGNISSGVHKLIEHGAMALVVPSVMPLGCFALILSIVTLDKEDYDNETGCLKRWNELVQYHNHLLQIELDRMRDLHPHATIIYADYYNAVIRVYRSPHEFGFSKGALSACCGMGGPYNCDPSFLCGTPEAQVICNDPSLHWNWDGGHPTEAGHRLIADSLINGPFAFPPITSPCDLSLASHLKHPQCPAKTQSF